MKKKTLLIGISTLALAGAVAFSCIAFANNGSFLKDVEGDSGDYTLTINAGDLTTETESAKAAGLTQVVTDSTKSSLVKNTVGISYAYAPLVDGRQVLTQHHGEIYNVKASPINSMKSLYISGANTTYVSWGWLDGTGEITYYGSTNLNIGGGDSTTFNGTTPNYFKISATSYSAPEIDQIIITYDKSCTLAENPYEDSNGIRYSKAATGDHYIVDGFVDESSAVVTLESEIKGLPVSEIGPAAFNDNDTITSINLDNITRVDAYAFWDCDNLVSIGDYSNITHYDMSAMEYCGNLNIATMTFALPSVYFGSAAFGDCNSIGALVFEDGCDVTMNNGCFSCMRGLTSVYIGDSVDSLDDFYQCDELASITVSEDNVNFKAVDNVLYRKKGENLRLLRIAQNRPQTSYSMPSNVTELAEYCAYGATTLESLVFNDTLTYIPDSTFSGCESLTSITFGASIEKIGSYSFAHTAIPSLTIPSSIREIYSRAFWDCNKLVTLNFDEGCTKLCQSAFEDCILLSSVVLPESLDEVGVTGGFGPGEVFINCPSLPAICTKLTSGDYAHAVSGWLGTKTLLYYSSVENNDGAHWHTVGSDNAPRIWTNTLYIQSNAEFSGDGTWYAVWAWTKGSTNGAFYYDSNAPVNYLYTITVPSDRNCFIVLRMKGGEDASTISAFPDGRFHNRTDDLENVLADEITITQWDNGMGSGNLGISYSLH